MRAVLSREQMQAFDRAAIEDSQVPGLVLMENAGRAAADLIVHELDKTPNPLACVVCGPGNNGGDGFVVARQLLTRGYHCTVFSLTPLARLKGDAAVNAAAWLGVGGQAVELQGHELPARLADFSASSLCIVDAVFGTGLDRDVRDELRIAIDEINRCDARRISLDVPSGLDANRGTALGTAVCADITIAFGHPKLGLLTSEGCRLAGHVHVVDIGVPPSNWEKVGKSADWLEAEDVAALVPRRHRNVNKVEAGRVAIVAGSPGMVGAALLAARGALRTGAGLVTIATRTEAAPLLEGRLPEAMIHRIDAQAPAGSMNALLQRQHAVLIGPGLGLDEWAGELVHYVSLQWEGIAVLDADALTHFRGSATQLRVARGPRILTPHTGELARLLGMTSAQVEGDRFRALQHAVDETGAVVILKGPCTLIGAPGTTPRVVSIGPRALATGGAGDVLGGIAAALACHSPPFDAAAAAAWLHAASAADWCQNRGLPDRGLLAHEIADNIPSRLASLTRGHAKLTD